MSVCTDRTCWKVRHDRLDHFAPGDLLARLPDPADAIAAERERVRAAVLALTPHVHGVPMVTVYEVIGVIDAEAPDA